MLIQIILPAVVFLGVLAGIPDAPKPKPEIRDLGPLPRKGPELPEFLDRDRIASSRRKHVN